MTDNEAVDSYVGYTYQGDYALVALLDSSDSAGISVETIDDIEIHGSTPQAIQVKHSLKSPPAKLTISNVGLWKTLRIWSKHFGRMEQCQLILVTMRKVNASQSIALLTIEGQDRTQIEQELKSEAERVVSENDEDRAQGRHPARHAARVGGCREFLGLSDAERQSLVGRIEIRPDTFSAKNLEREIANRLDSLIVRAKRSNLYERLIEWWHRQVNLSLLGKRPREIWKDELLVKIDELTVELDEQALVNDLGDVTPTELDLKSAHGVNLEKQIRLVDGGDARVKRATLARWRAMSQRDRWLNDSLATAAFLTKFDERLVEEWECHYGPMCDDLLSECADEKDIKRAGRALLDWSHDTAPEQLPPLKEGWRDPFLVRGSYQELAETLRVGWISDYQKRMKE